jgi:hypothetical protein
VIITRNRCLSNNRVGIICFQVSTTCSINSNIVVSRLDSDLSEPVNTADFRRKDGITISYDADNDSVDDWDCTCNGNIVRNCAWSGIYLNSNGAFDYDVDGSYSTVTGNNVSKCCMQLVGTETNRLQAGICVRGIQQVAVTGNVVHDIDPLRTAHSSQSPGGIRVYPQTGTKTGTDQTSVTISGNSVNRVGGVGIEIYSDTFYNSVSGNIVNDCDLPIHAFFSDTANTGREKEIEIIGNKLSKRDPFYLSRNFMMLVTMSGANRYSQKPAIIGNRICVLGAPSGGDPTLVWLNCDRFQFSDNWIEGASDGASGRGLQVTLGDNLSRRAANYLIANNKFRNLLEGIRLSNSTGGSYGPIVDQGSTFENVGTRYPSSSVKPGQIAGDLVNVMGTAAPTDGHWLRGDRVINSLPAVGQPVGWVCTASGSPGTWVALPNL